MGDTKLFDQSWREDSTSESSSKDCLELGVQTTNTHVLKFEVRSNDRLCRCSALTNDQALGAILSVQAPAHLLLVFLSLIALLGSLNQLISVPSMMIPMLSPSEPSKVEIERTMAFMIIPR